MKYPLALHQKLEEVRALVSTWQVDADFDHVIKWILQFDPSDYRLALAIIKNLNVIGQDDLTGSLSVAYSKLMRKAVERDAKITSKNTLFAGVGAAGKSGAMLSYHFRLINEISEENFLDPETERYIEQGNIENLVLVDDVIGTGKQASREIQELSEKVTPLGVKNIFLLTVCGFRSGIELVERETKAHTFSAHEYGEEDTAISFDSPFYDGISHDERARTKKRLEDYGRVCSKAPLGYGGLGAFIVFYYNTPNCTLPVVWSDMNDWIPLFRRVRRINGITSYYKQFDKAVAAKAKVEPVAQPPNAPRSPQEGTTLTLLVEGKLDEVFFDLLIARRHLASSVGVKKISVITLAGRTLSPRVLNIIARVSYPAVAVIDKDDHPQSVHATNPDNPGGVPRIFLEPNVLAFTRLESLYEDEEFSALLPPLPPEPAEPTEEAYFDAERKILRHGSIGRTQAYIRRIVDSYIDEARLEDFVKKLRLALDMALSVIPANQAAGGTGARPNE